jgi:hypothetical protein
MLPGAYFDRWNCTINVIERILHDSWGPSGQLVT